MRSAVLRVGAAPPLRVWVAETPAEQVRGLQGFPPLADDQGMVFYEGLSGWDGRFAMQSVSFPLDMIFLYSGVVGAIVTAKPGDRRVYSFSGANGMIEVAGGWAQRHGVTRGAHVVASL